MTSFVLEHGRHLMSCSISFSMTLQTEILSTETSDFFKQMIILKSFTSVLTVFDSTLELLRRETTFSLLSGSVPEQQNPSDKGSTIISKK